MAGSWSGRRVFLTGHTGFKGGWLAALLLERGAVLTGFAQPPGDGPGFFRACALQHRMRSVLGDILDRDALTSAVRESAPEVLFHLAAQPLVRRGHEEPVLTFETNVMGTVNVLEAARRSPGLRAVVVVTSDKCYEPATPPRSHVEGDPLGGPDPYSASKAATEMVAEAYRASYLGPAGCGLATVRGGNVIGGGDWAENRIVPDAVRAFAAGRPLGVRNPSSVRPWQHVLDLLGGYVRVAERLLADPAGHSEPWNFGPTEGGVPVSRLADLLVEAWPGGAWSEEASAGPAEARHLALDSSKAAARLGWRPRLPLDQAVATTLAWYRRALDGATPDEMFEASVRQIADWESVSA